MKLSKVIVGVAIGSVGVGVLGYLAGCGSTATSPTGPATNTNGAQPPPAPTTGTVAASTTTQTFAIQKLFLGDTDRMGASSATAWKSYGYNIDDKITTATSTDVCTRYSGAGSNNQVDGNNGIDNGFGATVLPIIQNAAVATPSATITSSLTKGSFTIMLSITGLTEDPKQSSTGLTGQIFAGGLYDPAGGTAPAFDMTTDWPVRPELLVDGKTIASGSKVQFANAYVANGTFVNGSPAEVTLSLSFGGVSLDLTVDHAIITFDHTAPGTASNGTIAGVINTESMISGLQKVAGNISTGLCAGTTFETIADSIRKASDILHDGTNVAGQPCDAISVGLGFTAVQIANPDKVSPAAGPSVDPCGDAGVVDSGPAPLPDSGSDTGTADTGTPDTGADAH